MATGSYLSIITLNVNGLNAPTKRHRLAERIQKQDPYICGLQDTHLKARDTNRLKVKGWKKIFHANRDQNKAGGEILISDKIDFKTKAVKRQIRSVAQSCPTPCDPMNRSTPGLPVHHQIPEFTQTHVPRVSDDIQPSHPLTSPSPPAPNPSQHQSFPMSQLFA